MTECGALPPQPPCRASPALEPVRAARSPAAAQPLLRLWPVLIVLLLAFSVIGRFFVGWDDAFPLSGPPSMPPGRRLSFGTDAEGRDLLAVHRLRHGC